MPRLFFGEPLPIKRRSEIGVEDWERQEKSRLMNQLQHLENTESADALDQKGKKYVNNNPAELVHIISSEDEDFDVEHRILSGKLRGFAGFDSPAKPVLKTSTEEQSNVLNDISLGKRNSINSGTASIKVEKDPPTSNKRKKEENAHSNEGSFTKPTALSPTYLSPLLDQVVEINSNSTTNTQRQQRLQRHFIAIHAIQKDNTKRSIESSSEFPVSSPSNPIREFTKFLQRSPLLKNTLPSDCFERQLAIVSARNPQMTLADKIRTWKCDPELSDVEDVNEFDNLFQRSEDNKRKTLNKNRRTKFDIKESDDYDFLHFRNVILKNLNSDRNSSARFDEHNKPSTSATISAYQLRRHKKDMRQLTEYQQEMKKTQSSTTPGPATSSSSQSSCASTDYLGADKFYYLNKKQKRQQNHFTKVDVHEQLLCSSSGSENILSVTGKRKHKNKSLEEPDSIKSTNNVYRSENTAHSVRPIRKLEQSSMQENSEFRLNSFNYDNNKSSFHDESNGMEPKRLIEMHLDFLADKKQLNLREKKGEIFKTPPVPIKHLSRPCPYSTALKDDCSGNFDDSLLSNFKLPTDNGLTISGEKALHDLTDKTVSIQHHEGMHQQHEFCSYLGLTGMSTANAMATAVAELARSNIARRSLRVRRQLHEQEIKDRQNLQALKTKKMRDVKQCEKEMNFNLLKLNESVIKIDESIESDFVADDSCGSQKSFLKNKPVAVDQSLPSSPKQKSKIKIVCHLAANDKSSAMEISKESQSNLKEPLQNALNTENMSGIFNNSKHSAMSREFEECNTITKSTSLSDQVVVFPEAAKSMNERIETKTPEEKTLTGTEYYRCRVQNMQSSSHQAAFKFPNHDVMNMEDMQSANTQEKLHAKFQEYLRASRLNKPRIFIVQSIESNRKKKDTEVTVPTGEIRSCIESSVCPPHTLISGPCGCNPIIATSYNGVASRASVDPPQASTGPTAPANSFSPIISTDVVTSSEHKKATGAADIAEGVVDDDTDNQKLRIDVGRSVTCRRSLKRKDKHFGKLLTRSVLNMTTQRQLRNRKIVILKTIKRNILSPKKNKKKLMTKQYSHQSNNKLSQSNPHIQEPSENISAAYNCRQGIISIDNDNLTESSPGEYVAVVSAQNVLEMELRAKSKTEFNQRTTSPRNEPTKFSAKIADDYLIADACVEQIPETSAVPEEIMQNVSSAVENELVVSSTTSCYDEQAAKDCNNVSSFESKRSFVIDNKQFDTKDVATQSDSLPTHKISQLTQPSSPLKNPLKSSHGKVLYIYYELDVLITVQEKLLSFWKFSKLLNLLNVYHQNKPYNIGRTGHQPLQLHQQQQQQFQQQADQYQREIESVSFLTQNALGEWLQLGECKRLQYDCEITSPFANRICVHNSFPIYVEMRCKELQKGRRDCNLLSVYINVYYYNDEDMEAKMHSIQLDTVQSIPSSVTYTTITDSRYFIMSWPQENILGKIRSGMCKYSLTPQLDTLASIREFKSMRHEISHLECTEDDKLLGFGPTQLTIWDHRSGDVLMNYDLGIEIGRNLGSVYYPSLEVGQNSTIVLFQLMVKTNSNENTNNHNESSTNKKGNIAAMGDDLSEVHIIACNISHAQPSHRVLFRHTLPNHNFKDLTWAINTGEHMLLAAMNEEELWINCNDPKSITLVSSQNSRRFYARGRSQVIELTEQSLTINSIANHILQIAAANSG